MLDFGIELGNRTIATFMLTTRPSTVSEQKYDFKSTQKIKETISFGLCYVFESVP
jgi:hypothetical protein